MTKKKKPECSKVLTIVNTVFFFGVVIFCLISWIFTRDMPTQILVYVAAPYAAVSAMYFGMAGYVNRCKVEVYGSRENCWNQSGGYYSTPTSQYNQPPGYRGGGF